MAASDMDTADDITATQHVESHTERRQSRNRKDPFLELSDKQPIPPESNKAQPESLLAEVRRYGQTSLLLRADFIVQLVLSPLYVISFIFSLLVVERQQRQWRLSQHAQQPQTLWERWFSSPEPYQENQGTRWRYHYSWKRRGVAKIQIRDVFEVRSRVALVIAVWSTICLVGFAYALRQTYIWLLK